MRCPACSGVCLSGFFSCLSMADAFCALSASDLMWAYSYDLSTVNREVSNGPLINTETWYKIRHHKSPQNSAH